MHASALALHFARDAEPGIGDQPQDGGEVAQAGDSGGYPIGFFHMDIAEVQTAEGKPFMFVAIDRTSKFVVTRLGDTADRRPAWGFLEHLLEAVPTISVAGPRPLYQISESVTLEGVAYRDQYGAIINAPRAYQTQIEPFFSNLLPEGTANEISAK